MLDKTAVAGRLGTTPPCGTRKTAVVSIYSRWKVVRERILSAKYGGRMLSKVRSVKTVVAGKSSVETSSTLAI